MSETLLRRRYRFFGAVQGVGLRWRARHAAEAVGATGWVCNNADGSVTLELQGSEAQLDRVLQSLAESRYIEILDTEMQRLPPETGERGFSVRDDRW